MNYLGRLFLLLPVACYAQPLVNLGNTVLTGGTIDNQEYFRGIPFAEPPVGSLRFQPPRPKNRLDVAAFDATRFGPGCIQAQTAITPAELSEDCLTINIQRPAGVHSTSRLPVLVWVYGGAFAVGGSSTFNATTLVAHSVARGTPTIYVNMNYRLSALGFPAGRDSSKLGILNLGLKDQLAAFEWIHKNIATFGGDPKKVTLFGESAGAMSISIHQFNPRLSQLARAVILESGTASSTCAYPRLRDSVFAQFAQQVGCGEESTARATLSCLQSVDPQTLRTVIAALPFVFFPQIDGPSGIYPDYASRLFARGKYVRIPTLLGTNLDENTLFTPTTVNTTQAIKDSILASYDGPVPNFTRNRVLDRLLELYPDIPALGSPYGTGNETFGFSSQFKRMSSLVGDITFVAPTRLAAQTFSRSGVKTYGYLFTEKHSARPVHMGVAHGAELAFVYGSPVPEPVPDATRHLAVVMMDYWLSFASALHPNDGKGTDRLQWVPYSPVSQLLMNLDGSNFKLVKDDFRAKGMQYIIDNAIALGV